MQSAKAAMKKDSLVEAYQLLREKVAAVLANSHTPTIIAKRHCEIRVKFFREKPRYRDVDCLNSSVALQRKLTESLLREEKRKICSHSRSDIPLNNTKRDCVT